MQVLFTSTRTTPEELDAELKRQEALTDYEGVAYGLSKAAVNLWTRQLSVAHPNLKINSCSPGMIATDIFSQAVPWWVPLPKSVLKALIGWMTNAKTPDEGTVSTMHLLFADLEGNGRYYGSDGKRSPLDTYRKPGSPPYEGP